MQDFRIYRGDFMLIGQFLEHVNIDATILHPVPVFEPEFGDPSLQGHLTTFKPDLVRIARPGFCAFMAAGGSAAFA
jgi:hypothetical protein